MKATARYASLHNCRTKTTKFVPLLSRPPQGLPPPARCGGRPADWVVAAKRRIRQRFTQPDAAGEVVR